MANADPAKHAANQRRWRALNPEKHAEYKRQWREANKRRVQWQQQKDNAKTRGIPFQFTYEEWVDWWGDDINNRGRMGLHMARVGDSGPYSPTNCIKAEALDNLRGLV